ncbi:MAG: DNA photolyase family protein [Sphingomonadales bacterium]|nr:DNA photolyase family protein [Sphingomonadales bacterium]
MTRQDPIIVWFRQDLRLADHAALSAAVESGRPVIPVYILDDAAPGAWRMGGASRWWLHDSLKSLSRSLADLGSRLILRRGESAAVLDKLGHETGAAAVYASAAYEPWARASEARIDPKLFEGATLHSFDQIRTEQGLPYRVFTPFWRACLKAEPPARPLPSPRSIPAPAGWPASDKLESWRLTPAKPDWAGGLRETWEPGEAGAHARLARFLDTGRVGSYGEGRDFPAHEKTSRLSPHLHFGEISPRQVWHAVSALPGAGDGGRQFLREVGWREFSIHLLLHAPHMPEAPLKADFEAFPWCEDAAALTAWQRGLTGYPLVDAGMRELWATGWMHNRVRMVAASFLVKHLLIHWRHGEDWFWDTLVDADLASNAASWQWVAGSGADAAPYFRIFNPTMQAEKFDPDGTYIRRWVPELARLAAAHVHVPWTAPREVLAEAGILLGETYPRPIVDHAAARARALAAYERIKKAA